MLARKRHLGCEMYSMQRRMVSGMRVLISMSDGSNSITPFCCSSNLQGHIAAVNKQAREGGGANTHTQPPFPQQTARLTAPADVGDECVRQPPCWCLALTRLKHACHAHRQRQPSQQLYCCCSRRWLGDRSRDGAVDRVMGLTCPSCPFPCL